MSFLFSGFVFPIATLQRMTKYRAQTRPLYHMVLAADLTLRPQPSFLPYLDATSESFSAQPPVRQGGWEGNLLSIEPAEL